MDTLTLLFTKENVDKLHLRYTEEIMKGALKAKDLIFVDDMDTFRTLHNIHPELKLCQTEPFLSANLYMLSTECHLSKLENLLHVWDKSELSSISLEAQIVLYLKLQKRGQQQKTFKEASRKVRERILKNHTPVSPKVLNMLRENPEIAVLKLPYLITGEDYSNFLNIAPNTLSKSARQCYQKVCTYLMQNGFASSLPEIIDYLSKIPAKEINIGAEIGIISGLNRYIQNNKPLATETYNKLSEVLRQKLSDETAIHILLTICQSKLLMRKTIIEGAISTTTITDTELHLALQDVHAIASRLNSAEINLLIAKELMNVSPFGTYGIMQELGTTLLTPLQPKLEDGLVILTFIRKKHSENSPKLHQCLRQIAHSYINHPASVELTEFKHWAINMANLRSPHAYDESDDTVFVSFYADSPYSLDWKHSLPMLLNCKTLSPKVRKEVIILIASHHAEELPDFLSSEDMKKLAEFKDDLVKNWRKLFE